MYPGLRLYTNLFQPTQKLVREERHGARVRRIYDAPATPYERVLACPDVSEADKDALRALYAPTVVQPHAEGRKERVDALFLADYPRTAPQPLHPPGYRCLATWYPCFRPAGGSASRDRHYST